MLLKKEMNTPLHVQGINLEYPTHPNPNPNPNPNHN